MVNSDLNFHLVLVKHVSILDRVYVAPRAPNIIIMSKNISSSIESIGYANYGSS